MADWLAAYEGAEQIFVATITGTLSGSYNAALLAAEEYKETHPEARVFVLDSLSADERASVEQLTDGPKHIDEIVDGCQLPAGRVLASMTLLEVKGYIRRLPARRFSLAEK